VNDALLRRQGKCRGAERDRQHYIFEPTVADVEATVARSNRRFLRARLHPPTEQAKRIVLPSDRLAAAERAVELG